MTEQELRRYLTDTAESYLGTLEGDSRHREILELYNSHRPLARGYAIRQSDPWCAAFVSAMAIRCLMTDIIPTEVSCGRMIAALQAMGRWCEEDSHVPSPGDLVFYDWEDDGIGDCRGSSNHVGIVVRVENGTVRAIEGNRHNAVLYREFPLDWKYLRGYGLPDFRGAGEDPYPLSRFIREVQLATGSRPDGIAGPETIRNTPTVCRWRNSTHDVVEAVQRRLTELGFDPGTADGIYGPRTAAAVREFQSANHCVRDGVITGRNRTWRCLLGMIAA